METRPATKESSWQSENEIQARGPNKGKPSESVPDELSALTEAAGVGASLPEIMAGSVRVLSATGPGAGDRVRRLRRRFRGPGSAGDAGPRCLPRLRRRLRGVGRARVQSRRGHGSLPSRRGGRPAGHRQVGLSRAGRGLLAIRGNPCLPAGPQRLGPMFLGFPAVRRSDRKLSRNIAAQPSRSTRHSLSAGLRAVGPGPQRRIGAIACALRGGWPGRLALHGSSVGLSNGKRFAPARGKSLLKAAEQNRYVPEYLLDFRHLPADLPDYVESAAAREAVCCVARTRLAWRTTPQAIAWLRKVLQIPILPPPVTRAPDWRRLQRSLGELPQVAGRSLASR